MSGILDFVTQFGSEEQCIEHLAELRWPDGYICSTCGGHEAWRLKARPRIYQCQACQHQESVTSGTVFHRTRTPLTKWFLVAYLMGRDKRGVSGKFLERELGVAYQTAWTMLHKLRHGLNEDPERPLFGYLEADETYIGGRRDPTSPGRSTVFHMPEAAIRYKRSIGDTVDQLMALIAGDRQFAPEALPRALNLEGEVTDAHADQVKAATGFELLESQDIADAILYALDAPWRVNVSTIELTPTEQAPGGLIIEPVRRE